MTTKKIPDPLIFMDLPPLVRAVALSAATIERLEHAEQFPKRRQLSDQRVGWAESRPVSNLPPPPNTVASKRKEAA